MGDPRRLRKKLEGPRHPFNKNRLEEEMKYLGKYGWRNKKEIWKAQTKLKNFRARARASLALPENLQEQERVTLVKKLYKLGIMPNEDGLTDEVLSLNIDQFLKRRLQSIVHEIGLAGTPYQSRQMIVHGHISVNGKKVTSPSFHVSRGEEQGIQFSPSSPYNDSGHPALTTPASNPNVPRSHSEDQE
jgi:small subunit ribosomal protein S4